jgi:iron complex outermembrane recepter protein
LNGAIDFVIEDFTEQDHYTNDARSGFMHGEYHITDKWSVSAGGRFSDNSSTANIDHPGLITGVIPYTVSGHRFDWLGSSSYRLTDDLMAYATAASGSRPPGITTIVNTIYQLQAIPQEELVSYEGGLKSEFFHHRLRLNLTGFYSDYSKRDTTQIQYQCLAQAPPPTPVPLQSDCPVGGSLQWYTTVARPATIRGFEFETTAEPLDGLLMNLDGGYNHFVDGVKTPGQPGYIVPGNLPMPEWNVSGGLQYAMHFPLLGGAAVVTPRLDWSTRASRRTIRVRPSRRRLRNTY